MWDLDTALEFTRSLESKLAPDWHCALGGGVLHRGESSHDLDVVVFPHDSNRLNWADLYLALHATERWERVVDDLAMKEHRQFMGSWDQKHVEAWFTTDGRRVDLLVLK